MARSTYNKDYRKEQSLFAPNMLNVLPHVIKRRKGCKKDKIAA